MSTATAATTQMASGPSRIAFIQSCWHRDIVDACRDAFIQEIEPLGNFKIETFEVPGAYEIPLQAKRLAQTGEFAAVVAAGLVVDGGIYRHDFVATAVINGLMQVQLETDVPVFTVVLTPHYFHSHDEHLNFFKQHFVVKGAEAAQACAQILAGFDMLEASA